MPPTPRSPLHARIGRRVRSLRLQRGLTQAELAEEVGCSNHFVSGIERGVDSPSLATLESLAGALGVTVAALVEPEQSEPHSELTYELLRSLQGKGDPQLIRVLREVIGLYSPRSRR